MFKPLTFEQYQKDVDDGWKDWCDDHVKRFRRLSLVCRTDVAKKFLDKKIEYFKKLRRMR